MKIPVGTYMADGGYSHRLLGNVRKSINLNATLSDVIGYETFNHGKEILYDGAEMLNKESYVYGARGRLALETYLSDRIVFLIQDRTKVLWNTSREKFHPSAGIELRFNF